MRLFALIALIVLSGVTATVQDGIEPNRFERYEAEDLDAIEARLIAEAQTQEPRRGRTDFLNVPTHQFIMLHRAGGPNRAEQHPDVTDVIFIKTGDAAIHIGGQIVNATGSEGELRGDSIQGGQRYPARAGDVFNVPPHVAHQWVIQETESISYFILKVREP